MKKKKETELSADRKLEERLCSIGQMRVLDMHAHLASLSVEEAGEAETEEALLRLTLEELTLREKNGIATCFSSGTPQEWRRLEPFAERREILRSFGIHPWYADRYEPLACMEAFDACDLVGEIGMDSVWCEVEPQIQRRVLEQQLQIASDLGKPILLHTKGQEREIAAMLQGFSNPICVHWYSGTIEDLKAYQAMDCYFTLGPDIADVYSGGRIEQVEIPGGRIEQVEIPGGGERNLEPPDLEKRALYEYLLASVPLSRLFVETDGIAAVAWAKGAENLPVGDIPPVLEKNMAFLAAKKGSSAEELPGKISENLRRFLCGPSNQRRV